VDWWALGVFIYEMMYADHVFFVDGVDQVDVVQAIIHEQLFDKEPVVPMISRGTNACMACTLRSSKHAK
jgi:hypothetical protein